MSGERVRALCAEIDWGAVGHAYGFATEIPFALDELAAAGRDAAHGMLVLGGLWGNVFHQGTRYDASVVTLPILVEIARDPACAVRTNVLDLVVALLLGSEERFIDTGYDATRESEEGELAQRLQAAFDGCLAPFVEMLDDDDAHVRASASRCLAWVRAPAEAARAALGIRFATEHDADVRATILYALSLLGDDSVAAGALSDADVVVRVLAALAVVRLRGDAAPAESKAVVRAAASVNGSSAVPFLRGEIGVLARHLVRGTDGTPDPAIANDLAEAVRARGPRPAAAPTKSPKAAPARPKAVPAVETFASDLSTMPRPGASADDRVRWASTTGNTIRIAGDFAQIGHVTGTAAVLSIDESRVTRLPWPRLSGGWTSAVVTDGDGGFVFGGQWTHVDGRVGGGIARFRGDGELYERWLHRWSGVRCSALARDGRTLFAIVRGGPLGGVPSLFAIDMETLDIVWRPRFAGEVTAIALAERTLFVGGRFGSVEGKERPGLAAFDVDRRHLMDLIAPPLARVPRRFAVTSRHLYIGSHMQAPRPGGRTDALLAINRDTGAVIWESGLGPDADVASLALGGDRIYVAGRFTKVGGAARNGACAFSLEDHRLLDWAPIDEERRAGGVELVHCLDDDTILVGGAFAPRGARSTKGIVGVDAAGVATGIDVRVAGSLAGVALAGRRVALAGGFPMVGEAPIDGAAEIDLRSGAARPWAAPTRTIASAAEDARGVCTSSRDAGGTGGRDVVVAHRGNDGSTWEVHTNERVAQIVLDETRVWIVGRFTRVAGQRRHYFACLSRATGALLPPRADFDKAASALARTRDHVFVAGGFKHVGREAISGLVRLDARDGALAPLPFQMRGSVRAMATCEGHIALFGSFSANADEPSERALVFDTHTSAAIELPLVLAALNGPGRVTHAAFRGGRLIIAGDFTMVNGHPRAGLAEIAFDGRVSDWAPRLALRRATPVVETLAACDERVVIGGSVAIVEGDAIVIDLALFERR